MTLRCEYKYCAAGSDYYDYSQTVVKGKLRNAAGSKAGVVQLCDWWGPSGSGDVTEEAETKTLTWMQLGFIFH